MEFETLTYTVENSIALVTLSRPDVLNAVNETMRQELASLPPLLQEREVRVVVFTGAGRAFCAGGDVSMFDEDWRTPEFRAHSRMLTDFYDALERLEKPVLAALNGVATGAGLQLALSCDIRFAAESARVGFRENFIGLIPGVGGITRTTRLVGPAIAKELIFSTDLIDAEPAREYGLVNRVYPDEELLDATLAFAERLTRRAPQALGLAKLLINEAQNVDLHTGRTFEALAQSILLETGDHAEGVRAFFEKRKAQFTGD